MSQEDLAVMLGLDPSTLAKWERAERVTAGQYLSVSTVFDGAPVTEIDGRAVWPGTGVFGGVAACVYRIGLPPGLVLITRAGRGSAYSAVSSVPSRHSVASPRFPVSVSRFAYRVHGKWK